MLASEMLCRLPRAVWGMMFEWAGRDMLSSIQRAPHGGSRKIDMCNFSLSSETGSPERHHARQGILVLAVLCVIVSKEKEMVSLEKI